MRAHDPAREAGDRKDFEMPRPRAFDLFCRPLRGLDWAALVPGLKAGSTDLYAAFGD
jgi:hypothetical protein